MTLLALLPIIKCEEKPSPEKCKYMIGTQSGIMMIKTNQIMIRVGGGFATIEDHIKQVGPFECIKIYKMMKGSEKLAPMGFKDAVAFCLTKLKVTDKIMKNWLNTDDGAQMGLFEAAIEYLKAKQDEAKEQFAQD